MPEKIKIKTWRCSCGYSQDFDPNDKEMRGKVFPKEKDDTCPSCGKEKLKKETNPDKKAIMAFSDTMSAEEKQEKKDKYEDK